jgi:hypothetical protein
MEAMSKIHRLSFYLLILTLGAFGGFMLNEKYFSPPCPMAESVRIENIKGKRGSTVLIDVSKTAQNKQEEDTESLTKRKGILKLFKRKRYE